MAKAKTNEAEAANNERSEAQRMIDTYEPCRRQLHVLPVGMVGPYNLKGGKMRKPKDMSESDWAAQCETWHQRIIGDIPLIREGTVEGREVYSLLDSVTGSNAKQSHAGMLNLVPRGGNQLPAGSDAFTKGESRQATEATSFLNREQNARAAAAMKERLAALDFGIANEEGEKVVITDELAAQLLAMAQASIVAAIK